MSYFKNTSLFKFGFAMLMLVMCGAQGWGQVATLPISTTTLNKDNLPTGFTGSGLGSNYTSPQNPSLRLDDAGDFLTVNFNTTPGTLTYNLKANVGSGSWDGAFTIQYSSDGSTWNTLRTISGSAAISTGGSGSNFTDNSIPSATRYLRWYFTTKTNGNVALSSIALTTNSPSLTPSPTSLSGFSYPQGSGPSVAQLFSLSGSNLTGAPANITVSASTNYEVSLSSSSGFSSTSISVPYSSATLSATNVYVRLKAGLSAGAYNSESIGISGGGASSSVSASGTVTAPAPANDLCANAIALVTNAAAISGTLSASTFTSPFTSNDVWYKFTVGCSGSNVITVTGFTGDVDIELFDQSNSCPINSTTFATSAGSTSTETITKDLTSGKTYYLRVLAFNAAAQTSTFTARVTTTVVPPTFTSGPTPSAATSYPGNTTATTYTVASSGSSFQWQYSSNGTSFANVANGTPAGFSYTGGTTGTLNILTTTAAPQGTYYYRAVATSTAGSCSTNSSTATFTLGQPPTPTTTSITPPSTTAGGGAFTLTVNGTNFVNGSSTVTFNGVAKTTTFVNATQLTAAISASDVTTAGTVPVGVTTTGATASSNTQTFTITTPTVPTVGVSATPALNEGTLNGATVSISLANTSFADATLATGNFTLNNAPAGVTIASVNYNTSTAATLNLAYDGTDFDADVTNFNITVAGAELTTGADITSGDLIITAVAETLSVSAGTTAFGNVCVNTPGAEMSFTITGTNLKAGNISVAALTGYSYSATTGGPYTATLSLSQTGGSYSQVIYVIFTPTSATTFNGNIAVSGGAAPSVNKAVTGTGVNTPPSVTTSAATSVISTGATLPGTIASTGCGTISAYGIAYNTVSGFSGETMVPASNLSGSNFSVTLSSLSPNTTYYYRAYVTNGSGTTYGSQLNFTTAQLSAPVTTAATNVSATGFTANWNAITGAIGYRLDVSTSSTFGGNNIVASDNFESGSLSNWSNTDDWINSNSAPISGTQSLRLNATGVSTTYIYTQPTAYDVNAGTTVWQFNIKTNYAPSGNNNASLVLMSDQANLTTGNGYVVGVNFSGTDDLIKLWRSTSGSSDLTVVASSQAIVSGTIYGIEVTRSSAGLWTLKYKVGGGFTGMTTAGTATETTYSNSTYTGFISKNSSSNNTNLRFDDFSISADQPSFVPGYENLAVSGTSQTVTGLTGGTNYYYRVRATSTNSTSPNSNTINVKTLNDQATADYVSNGSVGTANQLNWLYNTTGTEYAPATVAPSSTNNVTVRSMDDIAINSDFTVGAGKSFILEGTSTSEGIMVVNSENAFTVAGSANFNGRAVIFRSTATGTARLGQVTGTLSGATNVTVERYIGVPDVKRAYRLLTAPLRDAASSGKSIFETWQNGGDKSEENNGTLITGPVTATTENGIDANSPSYSLQKFNVATGGLVGINNTKTAQLFTGATNGANNSFFLFVRGDRTIPLSGSGNTTLKPIGALQTGNQTFALNPKAGAVAGGLTLLGNPYPSPVDFALLQGDNPSITTDYYFWDPNKGGSGSVGGYVNVSKDIDGNWDFGGNTPTGSGTFTTNIQSGQAIFVVTANNGNGQTVVFKENHKTAAVRSNVFRTGSQSEKMAISLSSVSGSSVTSIDGTLARYNNAYTSSVGPYDVNKLNSPGENIYLLRDGFNLGIESRPLIDDADTLFIRTIGLTAKTYQLTFTPTGFDAPGLTAFIEDNYLHTSTQLSLTDITTVSFTVTSTAASYATDRFMLVYKQITVLPINFTNVKAFEKGSNVQVEWNLGNELGISRYEVEKSADGRSFTKAGTQSVRSQQSQENYNWLDASPVAGNNFYRIKAIEQNGTYKYSQVVNVKLGKGNSAVAVYPNPVKSGVMSLQLVNQPAGKYSVALINNLGQQVYVSQFSHAGGSATQTIQLNGKVVKGVYQLQLTNGKEQITQQVIVE